VLVIVEIYELLIKNSVEKDLNYFASHAALISHHNLKLIGNWKEETKQNKEVWMCD
jgi:hypothetical protein